MKNTQGLARKKVVIGDTKLKRFEKDEFLFSFSGNNKRLMSKLLSSDKRVIDDGKLILEAINYGFSGFNVNTVFEQLVNNYALAEQLFGETIIGMLTGYNPDYVKKNIHLPEFRKELRTNISKKIEGLREQKLVDEDNSITSAGTELSSVILYIEELNKLVSIGVAERAQKGKSSYGLKDDFKDYKNERYRDIAIRRTIRKAIMRGHKKLVREDLVSYERKSREECCVIFALDASGSMKGYKIRQCKKAGIALAYKAVEEKNKVGLIVFGPIIKKSLVPTDRFSELIKEIASIRAANETNIPVTIRKAIEMFPDKKLTKHLILLSDALPTIGERPEQETLEAVSIARDAGITVSVVGIKLNKAGQELAERMVEIGGGRLYIAKDLENLDLLVLEDYQKLQNI